VYADRMGVKAEDDPALRFEADGEFHVLLAAELLIEPSDSEQMVAPHRSVPRIEVVCPRPFPLSCAPCGVLFLQHSVLPGDPDRFRVPACRVGK
jgi:hypothetical protein